MCGIAGVLHRDGRPASVTSLKAMTDIIAHRGPDGEGHYCDGPVGLGHRRLSIIDLTDAARQPMETRDGRYVLTYNGEIYNYQELKLELSARGHTFNSSGDSEVLLQAFAEWGLDALLKFNGMFAFAIWDTQGAEADDCSRPLRREAGLLRRGQRRVPVCFRTQGVPRLPGICVPHGCRGT